MNAQTIARLLEYFDFKQFFEQNPPLLLVIIFLFICLLPWLSDFYAQFSKRNWKKFLSPNIISIQALV